MRTFDRYDTFGAALKHGPSRAVLEEHVPDLLKSSMAAQLANFPLGPFLTFAIAPDAARVERTLAALEAIEYPEPARDEEPDVLPDSSYEDARVARGSAALTLPTSAEVNRMTELVLAGPSHGNPFVDVEVTATMRLGEVALDVGAFYDGDGRYALRFLPPAAGSWQVTTASSARSMDGIVANLDVRPSDAPGPVRVADDVAFAHADGTPYVPFGTTAYVWTHQDDALQDQTVATLAAAPFNKIRMGLFPKDFLYNANEPAHFVFPRDASDAWDTTRFDLDYFANLERRIVQLEELGIQADLILFHPYDRWGFSTMSRAADRRYLRYVVRRLAAYPNVWWSLANEYELLTTKRPEVWHEFAALVQREDHADHLLSIHNWSELYDYSAPWATHCSLQRGDHELHKKVDEWRFTWGKPVVIDEAGYEGDIDQGWGNRTAEDVVLSAWRAMVRGGYYTHGETFHREDDVLWWSKGGTLHGDSPARLGFLRRIVEESPTGRLDPLPADWDVPWGGAVGEYAVLYFGDARPRFRQVSIPAGMLAEIDVIDTWNMTIETMPGVHEGTARVDLPARPYMAIRLRRAFDPAM